MVNIQIPKDIREYQPSFIGPFTMRECICLTIAVLIEYVGVRFQTNILKLPTASFIPPLIIAIIPLFFGFGEKVFHMKPEVYMRTIFKNMIIGQKTRPYKTRNYYDVHLTPPKAETGKKKLTKKELEEIPEALRPYD